MHLVVCVAVIFAFYVRCGLVSSGDAFIPPIMGWASWCTDSPPVCGDDLCFEHEILSIAKAMGNGTQLFDLGYRWISLDDCWAGYRFPNGSIMWDENRFPRGMPWLADQIHDYGLKISLYTDVGTHTCVGNRPGAWPYYDLDAETYAKWKIDGIKADNCAEPPGYTPRQLYTNLSRALRSVKGHDFWFMMCEWGQEDPWIWGPAVANSWRTGSDHHPYWHTTKDQAGTLNIIQHNIGLGKYASSGHWNDPDYLEMGYVWQTKEMKESQVSLWAIIAAPFVIANDIRFLFDKREILNKRAIAVDQDELGVAGDLWRNDTSGMQIWGRPLTGGEFAVVFLNSNVDEYRPIDGSMKFSEIPGWPEGVTAGRVFDIWKDMDLGVISGSLSVKTIPYGGCKFLTIAPKS